MQQSVTRVDVEPAPDPETVVARVQYVIPAATKPFSYEYEPPPGVPRRSATFQEHRIPIHDARQLVDRPCLDVHGFAHRRQRTRVSDFYDDAEVKAVYYPELESLLESVTGARSILIFDHRVAATPPRIATAQLSINPYIACTTITRPSRDCDACVTCCRKEPPPG